MTLSVTINAYPEGLGELLQVGEGDGVRPWLSRPAEATSELLVAEGTSGHLWIDACIQILDSRNRLPPRGPSSLSPSQMALFPAKTRPGRIVLAPLKAQLISEQHSRGTHSPTTQQTVRWGLGTGCLRD